MNYRHAFHAGNFADCFKHALLSRALIYLMRKDAPLRFIDTHAGVGLYDLAADQASRTGEWRDGVGRLRVGDAPTLLRPWLEIVGARDAEGRPIAYPGSPVLAQYLLRRQDKMSLCEMHPQDAAELAANMGRDDRVTTLPGDGYAALNGLVPPIERRGLVLIDPPFEAPDEFTAMTRALLRAHAKWPTGCYLLWHPIKGAAADRFLRDLEESGVRRVLRLALDVGAESGLSACGLIAVNPPFALESEAREILPFFAGTLRRGPGAGFIVEWLVDE